MATLGRTVYGISLLGLIIRLTVLEVSPRHLFLPSEGILMLSIRSRTFHLLLV